jgi:putative ABC transport system substrate-binding protein
MLFDVAGKQIEILKGSISNCSAVALLWDANSKFLQYKSQAQEAADSLHVSLHAVSVRSPDELDQAFSVIAKAHADALLLQPSGVFFQQRDRIAQLALSAHMPTMAQNAEMAGAGVLMSYGTDAPDLFRRTATYIDKILKGAKPADLPVEQPTKFEFIINLKTANRLGLTIPPSVLARADKVIE